MPSLPKLPPIDPETGDCNVIIETPKGSRNKIKYDKKKRIFKLGKVLPAGMSFPFDFGYLPNTLGGDGDPLDVLALMDEPVFAGCLVPSRLIGVLEVEQTADGKTSRNDRLLAVPSVSRDYARVHSLDDLSPSLLDEIEHFFHSYLSAEDKQLHFLRRSGPERARQIVEEGTRKSDE